MDHRFVIQFHQVDSGDHYDLMFDTGREGLLTFRLDRPPSVLQAGQAMPAERLADHRRAYLEYQGQVSGNRGQVSIVEQGWFETVDGSPERLQAGQPWTFRLHGGQAGGDYRMERSDDGRFMLGCP